MAKLKVLEADKSYTFRSYFEMNAEPEDILADLGYQLSTTRLDLPRANKDDLTRGFTQLSVEMIALTQDRELDSLYGAVTIGDAWRFGFLDVQQKCIYQDLKLFTVPDNLKDIIQILIGVLDS